MWSLRSFVHLSGETDVLPEQDCRLIGFIDANNLEQWVSCNAINMRQRRNGRCVRRKGAGAKRIHCMGKELDFGLVIRASRIFRTHKFRSFFLGFTPKLQFQNKFKKKNQEKSWIWILSIFESESLGSGSVKARWHNNKTISLVRVGHLNVFFYKSSSNSDICQRCLLFL